MTVPDWPALPDLLEALEATWPPLEVARFGGLIVGRGAGGGGRLSSVRQAGEWDRADLDAALARQDAWGEAPLVRVLDGQEALAAAARARGMRPRQPTAILAAPLTPLAVGTIPRMTAFAHWPPLAAQRDLWQAHDITPARQQAMARHAGPHVALLGRHADRVAGTGFCAVSGAVAGLHAMVVDPAMRGVRLGEHMLRHAAAWAQGQGAQVMALAVTRENAPALRLYARLGFRELAGYTYFHAPRAETPAPAAIR